MTDRELLELAAKAAGMDLDCSIRPDGKAFYHSDRNAMALADGGWFTPRNNRADALNLSARLHINIEHGKHSVRAWTGDDAPVMVDETVFVADESKRSDAMCLAVTRAAAEIGRGM